jgi:YVTN family beta-propeller protein
MKLRATVVVIAAAFSLTACSSTSDGYVNSSGSVALSKDDALVYAADSDTNTVFIIDTKTLKEVAHVQVGQQPEKLLVAPDDTLYVTNRMSRSVSVIRRGDWKEAAQLKVGVEPVGLGVSADGKTLYVVNATTLTTAETGSLMAFDTNTLQQKFEIPVGNEPRGLAVLPNGKAMVSLLKQGDVALVDLNKQAVTTPSTDVNSRLNSQFGNTTGVENNTNLPPGMGGSFALNNTVHTRAATALAVSPDGTQVYATAQLSSNAVLVGDGSSTANQQTIPAGGAQADGYGGGSCGATAVSSPSVLTFSNAAEPKVSSVTDCGGQPDPTVPALTLNSGDTTRPIQGPVAVVSDPTGSFLYVVNQQTSNIAVVPTTQRTAADQSNGLTPGGGVKFGSSGSVRALVDTSMFPGQAAGPTGIALTTDGKTAFVYNSFEHTLALVTRDQTTGVLQTTQWVQVTQDTLSDDVRAGRNFFFNANEARMNNPGVGIACATCHVESREDGHVWNFTDGPRQTPSLAGRMTGQTAPYHWSGVFPTLGDFMSHTVAQRMGGSGFTSTMADQIAAYIDVIPAPDNPNKLTVPSDAQQRGVAVFQQAQCGTCHNGAAFTDNSFHDVGTFVRGDASTTVVDDPALTALNVPSLLGLARSAPYLHTGAAATIKERIMMDKTSGNPLHGSLQNLNDAQVDDLVAYLSSL